MKFVQDHVTRKWQGGHDSLRNSLQVLKKREKGERLKNLKSMTYEETFLM